STSPTSRLAARSTECQCLRDRHGVNARARAPTAGEGTPRPTPRASNRGPRASRAPAPATSALLRLVLVWLGLADRARGRRRRRRLLRPHEVPLLLVEPRVHVVADLEHRGTALAHGVVLAVVLCEQDHAERLAVAIAQRHAKIGGIQAEALHVLG